MKAKENKVPSNPSAHSARLDAVGVAGGTFWLLAAQNLPDTLALKPWLILAAPSVSLGLAQILSWSKTRLDGRTMRVLIDQATETIRRGLADNNTSIEHREDLRKRLERLQQLEIEGYTKQIEVLIEKGNNSKKSK